MPCKKPKKVEDTHPQSNNEIVRSGNALSARLKSSTVPRRVPTARTCCSWATEAHTASNTATHLSGVISLAWLKPFSMTEHKIIVPSRRTATKICNILESSSWAKPLGLFRLVWPSTMGENAGDWWGDTSGEPTLLLDSRRYVASATGTKPCRMSKDPRSCSDKKTLNIPKRKRWKEEGKNGMLCTSSSSRYWYLMERANWSSLIITSHVATYITSWQKWIVLLQSPQTYLTSPRN